MEKSILHLDKELKGLSVIRVDTGERLGEVSDALIHVTRGTVLALVIRSPEGQERALATGDFMIGKDAVMAGEGAQFVEEPANTTLEAGVAALRELVGTNVVTDNGRLLGRINDVYVSTEQPRAAYRVAASQLQRFLGRGFFIAGDLPMAYSGDGVRMIVPAETEDKYALERVEDALNFARQAEPDRKVHSQR